MVLDDEACVNAEVLNSTIPSSAVTIDSVTNVDQIHLAFGDCLGLLISMLLSLVCCPGLSFVSQRFFRDVLSKCFCERKVFSSIDKAFFRKKYLLVFTFRGRRSFGGVFTIFKRLFVMTENVETVVSDCHKMESTSRQKLFVELPLEEREAFIL